MRIPSSAYKAPGTVDGQAAEGVSKGSDRKRLEAREAETNGRRDAIETRVNVSTQARALATESAIDVAKIERLRAALLRGDFKVDARAIAARIVDGE